MQAEHLTRPQLYDRLVIIIRQGISRSGFPATDDDARVALDALIASDDAPEWRAIRVGREQLGIVIRHYRCLEA